MWSTEKPFPFRPAVRISAVDRAATPMATGALREGQREELGMSSGKADVKTVFTHVLKVPDHKYKTSRKYTQCNQFSSDYCDFQNPSPNIPLLYRQFLCWTLLVCFFIPRQGMKGNLKKPFYFKNINSLLKRSHGWVSTVGQVSGLRFLEPPQNKVGQVPTWIADPALHP